MKIRILVTGGTFDKEYDELTGPALFPGHAPARNAAAGPLPLDVAIETVMMIDSLDLDDAGRAAIVERARGSDETAIVITHGTDTMVRDRTRAGGGARSTRKTIVLTGAMVPYAFGSSDGLFNLGQRAVVRAGPAAGRVRRDERAALPLERRARRTGRPGVSKPYEAITAFAPTRSCRRSAPRSSP